MTRDIGMKNAYHARAHGSLPATYHRGSKLISAIFHSPNLQVMRTGILSIGIDVCGDHRNMFADFSTTSFLGQPMYMVAEHSIKTMKFNYSRVYKKFISVLKIHMQEHNLLQRSQLLYSTVKYPPALESTLTMEEMDSQLGRGIVTALKKCRRVRLGKIPYSAQFKSLQEQRRLWILV